MVDVPKGGSRFPSMDLGAANNECRSRDQIVFDRCGKCSGRVGLHCSDCKIQVTGCLCTEVDRFGNDETWRRAVERMGEEFAREQFRRAGLWIPGEKKLITPPNE